MRNSVKATVDAYDGTVTLYQVDRADPVLQTWMRVFPGTVQPAGRDPDELRAHFRYPEDLFRLQRDLLAKYHVNDPREFFTNNAFWSVPSDPTDDTSREQPPFYVLVGDSRPPQPSFRLASAMVGFNREFLSAYLSAHSDPENYGKIDRPAAADRHPDPGPAADPELDDLRHPRRIRAHPARAVQPDPLRQPADPADRRRRRPLRGTAVHRTV